MRAGRALRRAVQDNREYGAEYNSEPNLGMCPYFRGVGTKTCRSGCWEEPSCYTDMPAMGWPKPWVLGDARRRTHKRKYTGGAWKW